MSYPNDESMRISPETIYKLIYVQARGALKKALCVHLRSQRKLRKSKGTSGQTSRQGQIIDSQVATLVERTSRFLMLVRIESSPAPLVSEALAKQVVTLPEQLKKSLIWDRGSELSDHKRFTLATRQQ